MHDPEGAARQFRRLVRAYDLLTHPSAASASSAASWDDDLDPWELIMTEEFLAEALKDPKLPAFEVFYLLDQRQQRQQPGAPPASSSSSVWAEDVLGGAGAGGDALDGAALLPAHWRRVYRAVLRRRQCREQQQASKDGAAAAAAPPQQPQQQQGQRAEWRLFWEFAMELLAGVPADGREEGEDGSAAGAAPGAPLLLLPPAAGPEAPQPPLGGGAGEQQGDGEEGVLRRPLPLALSRQRRQRAALAQQDQAPQPVAVAAPPPQQQQQQQQVQAPAEQQPSQVVGERAGQARQPERAQDDGSRAGMSEDGEGPVAARKPRWLTWQRCWVWTKRLLLVKALVMLLRP